MGSDTNLLSVRWMYIGSGLAVALLTVYRAARSSKRSQTTAPISF